MQAKDHYWEVRNPTISEVKIERHMLENEICQKIRQQKALQSRAEKSQTNENIIGVIITFTCRGSHF